MSFTAVKRAEKFLTMKIAEMLNTINYEVVATLSRRVPRFYRRGGKIIKISKPVMYV